MTNLAIKRVDVPINTVYESYDYEQFSFMDGNRSLVKTNLNNLKKSFQSKPLEVPIIVNEKYEIVDGQHRFLVRKEMNLPIPYIVMRGYSLDECVLLNTVSQKWTSLTFLNSYCDQGFENYLIVKEFMDENNLPIERAIPFFTFGRAAGYWRQTFKEGRFEVLDLEKTKRVYLQYLDFKNAPAFQHQLFVCAVVSLLKNEEYDHATMQEKLKYQDYKLKVRSYLSEYTDILLDVYNYKTREGKKLTRERLEVK